MSTPGQSDKRGLADGHGPAAGHGLADGRGPADGRAFADGRGAAAGHGLADGRGPVDGHGPAAGHGLAAFRPRRSVTEGGPTWRDRWRGAGAALARLGLALAALSLGVALLVSLLATVWLMTDAKLGNLTQSMSIFTVASTESWPVLAAGLAGGVVVLWACWLAWRHGLALDGRRGAWALVIGSLIFQLVIILALQTRDANWGDSWMVGGMVDRAIAAGDVRSLFEGPYKTLFYDARLYFACYPFQAAYFWMLYGLRLAFGELSYLMLQVISALGTSLAVGCLLDLGRTLTRSAAPRRVLWMLTALCLPMYWLSTFLYLNALGFGLALAFLAMQARAMRARALGARLGWGVGSLVPLALALCVKATFVLFAFGALLAWVVLAVYRRSAVGLVTCVCVVAVANALSELPFEALRAASGGYEFGEELTTLNHLELGLRMGQGEFYVSVNGGSVSFAPGGWSNHANALWEASGEDAEIQNLAAQQLIAEHVVTFASDPGYAAWFFSVKLASEWADPTYQTLYYLSECLNGEGMRVVNPADLTTTLGLTCTVLTFLLDGYQSVTLAGAFGCLLVSHRAWRRGGRARGERVAGERAGAAGADGTGAAPSADASAVSTIGRNPVVLLLAATFFVGFGCYLLWEAKSVYLLPFAIAILPLSAAGLDHAFSWGARHTRRLGAAS